MFIYDCFIFRVPYDFVLIQLLMIDLVPYTLVVYATVLYTIIVNQREGRPTTENLISWTIFIIIDIFQNDLLAQLRNG